MKSIEERIDEMIKKFVPELPKVTKVLKDDMGMNSTGAIKKRLKEKAALENTMAYRNLEFQIKKLKLREQIRAALRLSEGEEILASSEIRELGGYLLMGAVLRCLKSPLSFLRGASSQKTAGGAWWEWLPIALIVFEVLLRINRNRTRDKVLDGVYTDMGRGSKQVDELREDIESALKDDGIRMYHHYPVTAENTHTVGCGELLFPDGAEAKYRVTINHDLSVSFYDEGVFFGFIEAKNTSGLINKIEQLILAYKREHGIDGLVVG
jgi:hypothetical protein